MRQRLMEPLCRRHFGLGFAGEGKGGWVVGDRGGELRLLQPFLSFAPVVSVSITATIYTPWSMCHLPSPDVHQRVH